jgi:3-oxoacyl-[acyl-carrier-protein] synthase II
MLNRSGDVWITGVGAATPLGHEYDDIADNLLNGRSGVRHVSRFNVADHPSQIGGQIEALPCPEGIEPITFADLHRQEQLLLWCAVTALRDAGWWEQRSQRRMGLVVGMGAEWLLDWEADANRGGKRIYEPEQNSESLVYRTLRKLELSGPGASVSAACASGNHALAQAKLWLERGWVDVCLAGACDMGVTPMALAGFGNLRALSRRNHHPQAASRPFDRDRDGFVISEGGAMFVLERDESARLRSARTYARVDGFGATSDAYHMVIPSPEPGPSVQAIRHALADARLAPSDVDYVNAHATGTTVGDAGEARTLERVFGEGVQGVPVSSTKSTTGHLLTAAAAMEALACVIAMQRRAIPPTINLDNIDPACNLCHVANQAQEREVRVAVSNSFGFGGSNTCLVLSKV